MKIIYTLCKGNENGHAERTSNSYDCLEDAIQEARDRNATDLALCQIHMEDVNGLWRQERGEDISELLTAGLANKELGKIAELACRELGYELSELDGVSEVICTCLQSGALPQGWWGVMEGRLYEEEEVWGNRQ